MRKVVSMIAVVLIVSLATLGWWRAGENRPVDRKEFIMGTYVEARAFGRKADGALDAVYKRFREIEQRMTINQADSEVARINQQAGQQPVSVSSDTFGVIQRALHYAEITGGKFDPTIQPIVSLWGIGSPDARVPKANQIADNLQKVDYQAVQLDTQHQTVFLPEAGMGIDLGGIAKGYAADEAVAILREHGVRNAIISLGGNVYTMGKNPKQAWRIGIQNPENVRNTYVAVIETSDETLVSSGAYERYLEADGKRYHHILDPDTGYPAESDVLSSTIITTKSIDADALSTSVFILGREQGLRLIEQLPGIEAVVIDKEHRVYVSSGMQGRLTVVDPLYQLMP